MSNRIVVRRRSRRPTPMRQRHLGALVPATAGAGREFPGSRMA